MLQSKSPEEILKQVFGYDSFRSLQRQVIQNVLEKKDTLAIMPTGGGKSICYQVPALIFSGITVVVSPLIALMEDQVSALNASGVPAVFLNSTLDWSIYCDYVAKIRSGEIKLLYVSPEALSTQRIQELLHSSSVTVSCITIDEAHCVSEWGHDFRPDYMEISYVRQQFPEAVCLALTATATHRVQQDIIQNLNLRDPSVLVASFDRENIFLEVKRKSGAFRQVLDCIDSHCGESGIIYCFSRKAVDELTEKLLKENYSALNYHAGLSDKERSEHQEMFIRDRVQIMVATVAFGMGINKPNVRFVIHYDMPKSLEQYYQEIGRAGRDGLASHALLLYSPADIQKIKYFFEESSDTERAEHLLEGMVSYATSRVCRRQLILQYFGEQYEPKEDSDCCCDVCSAGPLKLLDMTIVSQKFLSCIVRTKARYGASYIIDVLLGSKQQKILEREHDKLSTWGIGKELSRDGWFEICETLIQTGYIVKSDEYNILSLTKKACDALQNRSSFMLPVNIENLKKTSSDRGVKSFPKKVGRVIAETYNMDDKSAVRIARELKEWRRKKAEEDNVPPYIIFGDKTINDIAAKKPRTHRDLNSIYGIGEAKIQKFGSSIIRIVVGE